MAVGREVTGTVPGQGHIQELRVVEELQADDQVREPLVVISPCAHPEVHARGGGGLEQKIEAGLEHGAGRFSSVEAPAQVPFHHQGGVGYVSEAREEVVARVLTLEAVRVEGEGEMVLRVSDRFLQPPRRLLELRNKEGSGHQVGGDGEYVVAVPPHGPVLQCHKGAVDVRRAQEFAVEVGVQVRGFAHDAVPGQEVAQSDGGHELEHVPQIARVVALLPLLHVLDLVLGHRGGKLIAVVAHVLDPCTDVLLVSGERVGGSEGVDPEEEVRPGWEGGPVYGEVFRQFLGWGGAAARL